MSRLPFQHKRLAATNLKKIRDPEADVIYLAAGPPEVSALIERIRLDGIHLPILGGDSYSGASLQRQNTGDIYHAAAGFLSSQSHNKAVQTFVKAYTHAYRHKRTNVLAALGYDTVTLSAQAIEQANGDNVASLKWALNRLIFSRVTGKPDYGHGMPPVKPITVVAVDGIHKSAAATLMPTYVPPANTKEFGR